MDNAQLRVMKKKNNKKIASLDKKNKNFCHLGKRGRLIKNAKAWEKRHKNRQMMEHKIILLVRVNVFNSTHPTKRNFSIIIYDYPHLSVTTSSPKGNRQEVSVHVGNYFM